MKTVPREKDGKAGQEAEVISFVIWIVFRKICVSRRTTKNQPTNQPNQP